MPSIRDQKAGHQLEAECSRAQDLLAETRKANAKTTHIQVQNYERLCQLSCLFNTHQLHKHTVPDLFNMCSNHAPLNYSAQESKQFAAYDSDIPGNLK